MIKKMLVGYIQDGRHSGIDKYLLGFCEVAYQNGVTLDFLTDGIDPELKTRFDKMGFSLFEIPSLKDPVGQYKAVKQIIKNGGYDAAYFNISEAFNCPGLFAAAACKLPVRIVHSHSSGVDKNNKYVRTLRTFLHKIFRLVLYKKATKCLACSDVAGKWMFPCGFEIIYNAVDNSRFTFDPQKREQTRKALGIEKDTKVFIHVGHCCYVKNNFFLMQVMSEIVKKDSSSLLISVGSGPDFEAVADFAKKLGIDKNIKFLGIRQDIPDLLCAADAFIFPSRFEGLGIACVEAQFSGLPCVVSTGIPKEAQLSENVTFLSFDSPEKWAVTALEYANNKRGKADLSDGVENKYSFDASKAQLLKILETEQK